MRRNPTRGTRPGGRRACGWVWKHASGGRSTSDSQPKALFRCFGLTPSSLEDAVQDVLLTAYRRLGRFDHRSSVRTWPFGIAYRVALDYRRHQRSKGRLDEQSDDLPALAPQQVPGRLVAAARLIVS